MAFNEPDQASQSHVSPDEAATLWLNMTAIAKQFDLKLIVPCVSNAHGAGKSPHSTRYTLTLCYGNEHVLYAHTMKQMLPKLDAADYVYCYSWHLNRDPDMAWFDGPGPRPC